MRLSPAILSSLDLSKVAVPSYDRSKIENGILHLGLGNFHRAHLGAYMHDLFEKDLENNKGWGIVGGGIRPADYDKRNTYLGPQGWLWTLVQRDATSLQSTVIGSMVDFLPVDSEVEKFDNLLNAMSDPSIKIISLTVTEGGYFLADGKFNAEDPEIIHDIENPDKPTTIFGMMVYALRNRKADGIKPFTVMCCDNIPHNGDVTKSVVVGLAERIDPDLAKWIDENVAFPNSMVDRITPGTTDGLRDFIRDELGYEDTFPVACEPFCQWVLEDEFSAGRPTLEKLNGVTFVDDVSPYENMKIRILNGGHATLCYPSGLMGVEFVHQALEHPTIGPFLDALEQNEIIPTVKPVPEYTPTEYWKIIQTRFSNPTIEDTIDRICFDGASRQPKFIVPVAADRLKEGKSIDGLALVSAMWCRYCQGKRETGEEIPANDPQWDRLQELAQKASNDPAAWLGMKDIYGSVGTNEKFVEAFSSALKSIEKDGVEAAMKKYLESNKS